MANTVLGCDPTRDCSSKRNPYEPTVPTGPVSPVNARISLQQDPGIVSPVLANLHDTDPVTVMVEFDAPVAISSFTLKMEDLRCDYTPEPVPQEVNWLSDRAAATITSESWPTGKPGPYAVTFGGGRDAKGNEVQEVRFQIQAFPMTHTMKGAHSRSEAVHPRCCSQ